MKTTAETGPALLVAAPLAIEALALVGAAPGTRVCHTGAGPSRARRAAARLRERPGGALVVLGVAGAVGAGLAPGTLVIADSLVGPGDLRIALDPRGIAAALEGAGLRVHLGSIAGVERPATGAARTALAARGVCAADMESYWLAEGAASRPFAVVRAIVDGPDHELWRPGTLARGLTALRRLRAAVAPLRAWAEEVRALRPRPIRTGAALSRVPS